MSVTECQPKAHSAMLAARRLATVAARVAPARQPTQAIQRRRFFLFGSGNNAPKGFGHFYPKGAISASRGAAAPSRHRRASSPGEDAVAGFFFDFEAVRTVSSEYDAPRRSSTPWPRPPTILLTW